MSRLVVSLVPNPVLGKEFGKLFPKFLTFVGPESRYLHERAYYWYGAMPPGRKLQFLHRADDYTIKQLHRSSSLTVSCDPRYMTVFQFSPQSSYPQDSQLKLGTMLEFLNWKGPYSSSVLAHHKINQNLVDKVTVNENKLFFHLN
ncbi:MAG: hypothetical protein ACYCQJ_12250 [Nitrososphaerales archaeon]